MKENLLCDIDFEIREDALVPLQNYNPMCELLQVEGLSCRDGWGEGKSADSSTHGEDLHENS